MISDLGLGLGSVGDLFPQGPQDKGTRNIHMI